MPRPNHQTVRLDAGRHRSQSAGVCVMELASMLAGEAFSDRSRRVSPVIGAFLRTYNDGLDDERRQDLYPVAAAIVGSTASRRVERERNSRCLAFARRLGGVSGTGRGALALASAEGAGSLAALAALGSGPSSEVHAEALALVDELIAQGIRSPARWRRWPRRMDPAHAVVIAARQIDAAPTGGPTAMARH